MSSMISTEPHILVTGANGFVGRHLVDRFKMDGIKCTQLLRGKLSSSLECDSTIFVDLLDKKRVEDIFFEIQPNYVIHLAALKGRSGEEHLLRREFENNLTISTNVIDGCLRLKNLQKFIYLGSCEEYGTTLPPFREDQQEAPISMYGMSKLAVKRKLSDLYYSKKFPSLVLRPSVVYGPNQGCEMFLPALINALLEGRDFRMTEGIQLRDFIYIDDLIDAIMKSIIANNHLLGSVVNIASGSSIEIRSIAKLASELIGGDVFDILKFGFVPYRDKEIMNFSVDIARAKTFLNWHPNTELKQGLFQTIDWYRKFSGNR